MKSEVKLLSGGTPKKSEDRYWDGTIPWVSSGEMVQRRISDTELHVTDEGVTNGTKLVPANTVLVVVRGMSLAKEFRVSLTLRPVTFNQDLKALKPSAKIDPGFLFYYLQSQRHAIRDSATDASHGTKKLESRVLESWPLPIPDLTEQYAIRDVLSAYDDLIENNRRRIQLLEEAARLLYREWFVHLRFPGHEHVAIKDGVPEGWKRKALGELCTLRAGITFKPKYQGQVEGDYPFIKVRDMNSAGNLISITEADNWITSDECYELRGKPFPPGTSVFAKIGEAIKKNRVRFIVRDTLIDNNMMGAIPNRDVVDEPFLYYLLSNYDIASNASGAALPFLSTKVLSKELFLVPDASIRHLFNVAISPSLEQITTLQIQNTKAARARDLLLPRLMNGEVTV